MDLYDVPVQNQLTGEQRTVSLRASWPQEAQVAALVQLFRLHEWRKAVAFPAERRPIHASGEG
jgi:hypothetical protein